MDAAVIMHIETVGARRSILGIDLLATHAEPQRRAPRGRGLYRGPMVRTVVFGAVASAIVAGLADLMSKGASARSVEPPQTEIVEALPSPGASTVKPLWIEVNRPIQLFALAGSEFSKLPLRYRARRRPEGAERQDLLIYGRFGTDTPYLSLSIRRTGAALPASLFVALARLAADHELAVVRSGTPIGMATRFGDFATADLTLGQGAVAEPCLGFRLETPSLVSAPVEIAGFACGTAARPVDRETLACVLDRVDLVSAGDDAALQRFFVDAERRRGLGCGKPRLLAAGWRATWLDGEVLIPPLKHLHTGNAKAR